MAPSDPKIVWAGTGETHIRSNVSLGTGVYKSTDGGETWHHMGLAGPSRTSRIVIHPKNSDIVYVAALGHSHGPQAERGVFRAEDGGETWEHVLFVDENTGASSLEMDLNNPRILFAGMWQIEIHTWGSESGGAGSGIHMSRDGGDTWTKLEGNGLPKLPVGKVGICLTPADSDRAYVLIETGDGVPWHGQETESGELWRSDDGGKNWQLMTHNRNLSGRTHYYNNCFVTPDDPDEALFLSGSIMRTKDGGRTATSLSGRQRPGSDHHDMWIDPTKRGPDDRRQRLRYGGFGEPGQDLAHRPAPHRPDVPRDRGQRDPLQRLGQPAGRSVDARSQQKPNPPYFPWHGNAPVGVAWSRRRRERFRDCGSHRPEHHLVECLRLRRRGRDRGPLQRD